jgi:hypothetical protein
MTDQQKAAMQAALDVLLAQDATGRPMCLREREVIAMLRTALAQDAEAYMDEPVSEQEHAAIHRKARR